MIGGLCIPETRKAITAVAPIGKNDFDTSDKKLDSNRLNNKKFIIRHNEKSQRRQLSCHQGFGFCPSFSSLMLSIWAPVPMVTRWLLPLQASLYNEYPEMDEKKRFFLTHLFRD